MDVKISSEDSSCIEVMLRCLAVEGDGLGFHEANDGGLLATVMADGFKGYSSCHFIFPFEEIFPCKVNTYTPMKCMVLFFTSLLNRKFKHRAADAVVYSSTY